MYHNRLASGIIVLANRTDDPRIEELWKEKVPLVLIPGGSPQKGIPSVDVDNVDGAIKAVEHLASLGHRRIAFLVGPMNSKYSTERLTGYCKALEKNRLPFQKKLVMELDLTQENAYAVMKKLLSLEHPPTAVLVINDYSAMGALRVAQEMSFKVPEGISIIGFGDVPFASMTDPPLTTIRAPYQEMGHEAANMLVKLIREKMLLQRHLVLPVELIVRKSTARPPKRKAT